MAICVGQEAALAGVFEEVSCVQTLRCSCALACHLPILTPTLMPSFELLQSLVCYGHSSCCHPTVRPSHHSSLGLLCGCAEASE